MGKFAVLNSAGQATAFYCEAIHGSRTVAEVVTPAEMDKDGKVVKAQVTQAVANPASTIPADAVPLTDAQYSELAASNGSKALVGGQIVDVAIKVTATVDSIRRQCVKQLAATQWTQDPSNSLPSKAAFGTYRQQLMALLVASTQAGFDPTQATVPAAPGLW